MPWPTAAWPICICSGPIPRRPGKAPKRGLALADGIPRRERRHIAAVSMWAHGKGPYALRRAQEHLAEYPRDALLLRLGQRLYMLGCSGAGVADFPPALFALMQQSAPHCGDDWAFLGQYAFAHHEVGILDQALKLAERSLEQYPGNAVAAHSVTHVLLRGG